MINVSLPASPRLYGSACVRVQRGPLSDATGLLVVSVHLSQRGEHAHAALRYTTVLQATPGRGRPALVRVIAAHDEQFSTARAE